MCMPSDIIRTDKKGVMAMADAILALPEGQQMHVVASGALTNVPAAQQSASIDLSACVY